MSIRPISNVTLRNFLKAARWFLRAPGRRCRLLLSRPVRTLATGMQAGTELACAGALQCADAVVLGRRTRVQVPAGAELVLGEGAWVGDDCEIAAAPRVVIGAHTSVQDGSRVLGEVSIGAGCVIGPNFYVSSRTHHFSDDASAPIRWQDARAARAAPQAQSQGVAIGEDCWLGINVVVLRGLTVGRGCVIGANAVLTQSLPPYSVAAGAPARVLRQRLRFQPPAAIRATEPEHIPYFYAGFRQWGPGIDGLPAALLQGAWRAPGRFTLALAARPGDAIMLDLKATQAGSLQHSGQRQALGAGAARVRFLAAPADQGLLDFVWTPAGSPCDLLLLACQVADVAAPQDAD